MKIIGLTGGIGMGKTTAADFLKQWGYAVADTDLIARQVVEPGQPALREIVEAFGDGILEVDGLLRRDELGRQVFADEAKRRKLEAIMHPRIRAQWLAQVGVWQSENRPCGIIVIPLLFETQSETHFDTIVCVACEEATRRERLRARGWTDPQIDQRIRAQWPSEPKMALAHHVIWTEGTLVAHAEQLRRVMRAVLEAG